MKKNKSKDYVPWNKGLSKDTDERVAKFANTQHQKVINGEANLYWKGKHLPDEIIKKMKDNPNCGGLRPGSGRGKMGYYKGYYCRSSWELAWIVYQIEHNIINEPKKNYNFQITASLIYSYSENKSAKYTQ